MSSSTTSGRSAAAAARAGGAVGRLSDDGPALRLQPAARGRPEAGVVVHDEDPLAVHGYGVHGRLSSASNQSLSSGTSDSMNDGPQPVAVHPPAVAAGPPIRRVIGGDRHGRPVDRVRATDRRRLERLTVEGERDLRVATVGFEGPHQPDAAQIGVAGAPWRRRRAGTPTAAQRMPAGRHSRRGARGGEHAGHQHDAASTDADREIDRGPVRIVTPGSGVLVASEACDLCQP